jgi:thioredoxin-dependent peroxiredoxin
MRLHAGQNAPTFTLPSSTGQPISLTDFAHSRVILYAYPAAMTPGCTTQACDFRDNIVAFNQAKIAVLGISPDPVDKLREFAERDDITFPLLADPDHTVLAAYGAWGEKQLYGKTVIGVIRSTFVIAADGTIEEARYNVKATGHVAKLMRELDISSTIN